LDHDAPEVEEDEIEALPQLRHRAPTAVPEKTEETEPRSSAPRRTSVRLSMDHKAPENVQIPWGWVIYFGFFICVLALGLYPSLFQRQ